MRKSLGTLRPAGTMALAMALFAGCDEPKPAEPVRLGLLAAFTAAGNEGNGVIERRSVQLAVEEANAAGGVIPGRPVELVAIDYGETYATVTAAAATVAAAGLAAMVGPEPSKAEVIIGAQFVEARLPHVSCCASSDTLDDFAGQVGMDRYFFRTTPPDSQEAVVTSRLVRECGACSSIVVFQQDDAFGTSFASRLLADLASKGGPPIAADVTFVQGQTSYASQVQTAGATSADCAVVVGFPSEAALLLRNWQTYVGRPIRWFASSSILSPVFASEIGNPALAEGMRVAAATADMLDPQVAAFHALYEGRFREPASLIYGARNYDAAALLLLAIARAGSTDGAAIRDALFEISRPDPEDVVIGPGDLTKGISLVRRGIGIDYDGASGPVDFDASGNVTSEYEILRFDATATALSLGLVRTGSPLVCAP